MFDAAIFVSIRAHTKMGAPVVLEMFDDTTNRPLAPVSYIGPEKSKVVVPLTQEQLETQVQMMFCVLEQCHTIQRDLCNGLKDEEISSFQTLFQKMGTHLNNTFSDLRRQETHIHEMSKALTDIRFRCIQMFSSIYNLNNQIPWLNRKLDADWMPVYERAKAQALTLSDADVWNRMNKHKSTIENTIGKDAMFKSIHTEHDLPPSKKAKHEDPATQPDEEGAESA